MGLEAYRIGVKFKDFHTISEIVDTLVGLGASIISIDSNGDVSVEFTFSEGIVEILVSTIKDQNKILFELTGKQSDKLKIKTNDIGNAVLNMRFAKANSSMLVTKIIELLKKLNTQIPLKFINDIEGKCHIDLDNYSDFQERVNIAKQDFHKWFPTVSFPVRCNEVFEKIRNKEFNQD